MAIMSPTSSFDPMAFATASFFLVPLLIFTLLFRRLNSRSKHDELWDKLDNVGLPPGVFPWTRAIVRSLTSMVKNIHEGYYKFSKALDQPFALPTMWTGKAVVVLPPTQLHLVNRPDNEIIGFPALVENVQLSYFIHDREVIENAIHFEVSRKDLTLRNIERQVAPSADEIDVCFRDLWGIDTDNWRTVNGWETCGGVIARTALRTLVGYPMCRNDTLREQTRLFANSLFAAAGVINCTPPFLRPIVGPVLALRTKYHGLQCQKLLKPLIRKRIQLWEDSKDSKDVEVPNDFLQWMIPRCANHGPANLDPDKIALRFLLLNTMFVYAMSYIFSQAVVDIFASPEKDKIVLDLEHECRQTAMSHPEGISAKEVVDKLYRVDSAIRESMRISDAFVYSLFRDVVGKKPLDLGNGILVPPGTRMVFPTQEMHGDPDNWEDPQRFNAFRFSRPFEPDQSAQGERELLTTLTPKWLAFGYGKKACPGRWFAAQTLKQALAYIVMNYDVELLGEPPKRRALLNMMLPPTGAKLRLRRKLGSVEA
ncbi:cytochrome P450 [Xylariaceae sp. FL0662B]|nr:cytochrome P450 [Xylariaceae sp. FL0662B]